MNKKRIFTTKELADFAVPMPDRIIRYIRDGNLDEAVSLCNEMKKTRIDLHDFFADSCTILWSWVGEHLGEDTVEDMFRYIFDQTAKRQVYCTAVIFRMLPKISISILAETAWRSHCCFGYGEFPAEFSVTEDEKKFTFHMHPCASGCRLWLRGIYEPGRGGKLTEKAHRWTFNRKDFPYYCIHSAFLNEILPYEEFGYIMWPTDEPEGPDDECRWHIYKDPNDIPDKYYERIGVKKNYIPPVPVKRKKKIYFSEDELKEMARPMTDRIREKILGKDLKEAHKLCMDIKDEFLFLHDLYTNMILATFTFISERAGELKLGEALDFQYEKCIKEQLVKKNSSMPSREILEFLALKIFGIDNCNQTGFPKGRFTVSETDESVIFKLDPCGSGGRLLRGGAYDSMTRRKKFLEGLVDFIIVKSAMLFSLPDSIMKWNYSSTGGIVTQRKSFEQGRTASEHSWSFKKKNMPYYCCQCGMLQEKTGKTCLEIYPPEKKDSPCIWILDKSSLMN